MADKRKPFYFSLFTSHDLLSPDSHSGMEWPLRENMVKERGAEKNDASGSKVTPTKKIFSETPSVEWPPVLYWTSCTERKPSATQSSQKFPLKRNHMPRAQTLLMTLEKLEMSGTVKSCCGYSSEVSLCWRWDVTTEICSVTKKQSSLSWINLLFVLKRIPTTSTRNINTIWDAISLIL